MKVYLLHHDRDFHADAPFVWNHADLVRDLALNRLFSAMALDDDLVEAISRRVLLGQHPVPVETVVYRQDALQDVLNNPQTIRALYSMAGEALALERNHYLGSLTIYPAWVLRKGIDIIAGYLDLIRRLRDLVDRQRQTFTSTAFKSLFDTLQAELSDDFLIEVRAHLADLTFPYGETLSATLGEGAKGKDYRLLRTPVRIGRWWERWIAPRIGPYGFSIHPRDESGARALEELRACGTAAVAAAVGQSADHIRTFFVTLRNELAFYTGCLNLSDEVAKRGGQLVRPAVTEPLERRLGFRELRDIGLVLAKSEPVVGNDLLENCADLILVTGANQGGKSTFLRSVGCAQLMAQAGLWVAADHFETSRADGVFTHHKREEDPSMSSGKLDEELKRMSEIVDHLGERALVLFNESFSATNEREGSEIARQIITGLLDHGARVVCVTHLFELARNLGASPPAPTVFLRADRSEDRSRSFRLSEGPPLETSFGDDLYLRIFGEHPVR